MADLPATPDYQSTVIAIAYEIAKKATEGLIFNSEDAHHALLVNYTIRGANAIRNNKEIKVVEK